MSNPDPATAPRRRKLLLAGIGAAAFVAGTGIAIWKRQPDEGSAESLWPLTFESPSGTQLTMNSLRGKPLLVNFWATWCPPCVEEMPLLDGFYRQNSAKSWQVVGLAIDQPSAVRAFLQRTPVSYPVGFAGLGGSELAKALGDLSGGLPFTVVLNEAGRIAQRKMGRLTAAELARWSSSST